MNNKQYFNNIKSIFNTLILQEKNVAVSSKIPLTEVLTSVPAAPSAIPLYEIIRKVPYMFPRTIKQSMNDYSAFKNNLAGIQSDLLSTLPFYPKASNSKCSQLIRTPIDDEGNYINEFCVMPTNSSVAKKDLKHLVLMHGYGAGLGFFLKNLENIPLLDDEWCIHAIDLPGYGYSSRKTFPFKIQHDNLDDVQDWFHSRIRTWFDKRSLLSSPGNNLIMAHSIGAFLMASYVDKNPNDFKKLVMCSPAGICESTTAKSIGNVKPPWWFNKLWENNVSPFALVRNSSYMGSKFTSGWSYRRFNQLLKQGNPDQFEHLHKYSYSIFNQKGCGEYLLSFALKCGGEPRYPLQDHLFKDNHKGISKSDCEWIWIYGERDWMDVNGGKTVTQELSSKLGKKSTVYTVPNSGHHLYLDNYDHFNNLLIKEMKSM